MDALKVLRVTQTYGEQRTSASLVLWDFSNFTITEAALRMDAVLLREGGLVLPSREWSVEERWL